MTQPSGSAAPTFDPTAEPVGDVETPLMPSGGDPNAPPPPLPQWLPERYEDLGYIGRGGMAQVFRVRDRHLRHVLALKVLRPNLAHRRSAHDHFLREARVTARLRHPSIVAVQDLGQLPDGRPWFTMTEVQGETLAQLLARTPPADAPLALVRILAQACDAVGHAHAHGVVHRDLKPDNLMIGAFGEVMVMDWGIAHVSAEHVDDSDNADHSPPSRQVWGTPAYMPPEQASGHADAALPTADVYALGAVLYQALTGAAPYPGDSNDVLAAVRAGPPPPPQHPNAALVRLCQQAMARDRLLRHPSAAALAADLRAWETAHLRRSRAMALLDRAHDISRERAALSRQRADHTRLAAADPSDPPVEAHRFRLWDLQDELAQTDAALAGLDASWQSAVLLALEQDPDLPEAHALLARHYRAALVDAENAGQTDRVPVLEARLGHHDRAGRHRPFIDGHASLTLPPLPPGAQIQSQRFTPRRRRLDLVDDTQHAPTTDAIPLRHGSYLLTLRAPGHCPARVPVRLRRGAHVDLGAAPAGATPARLLPLGALEDAECYVPAGWFWCGGDPLAADALDPERVWVDGFVIQRDPVTQREWIAWLNALVDAGAADRAHAALPRRPHTGTTGASHIVRDAHGRYQLGDDCPDGLDQPDSPLVSVDWFQARAYCQWRADTTGLPWRLPNELEWEKAARGADARRFVWGDHPEPSWANVVGSRPGPRHPTPIGSHPGDVSVYGVRGLAGNVRDWCANIWLPHGPPRPDGRLHIEDAAEDDPRHRAVRGGAWQAVVAHARVAVRMGDPPGYRYTGLGLRLCRSIG